MKILCTGNPNKDRSLAKSIQSLFPETVFVSISQGTDLLVVNNYPVEDYDRHARVVKNIIDFQGLIANFDVFINAAYIDNGNQTGLLKYTQQVWERISDKKGLIINIGSINEFEFVRESHHPVMGIEKNSLRQYSLLYNSTTIRTSHLIIAHPGENAFGDNLNSDHIARNIKSIIDQTDVSIPLMFIM